MTASLRSLIGRTAGLLVVSSLLSGCATAASSNPRDPFERFNRGVYQFNEQLDRAVFKPVAEGYRFVLPSFVRQSVSNVFSNLSDVRVGLNNALQGKFTTAYSDFGRVMINSTLGVLGLFDIASEAGIEKHDEDFGQTLGRWGVGDGPFLMLPILGPSSVRDTAGLAVDYFTDPVTYVDPSRSQNQLTGTRLVNRRAELLDAKKVLDAAALDQYEFLRDAYLQRRGNLIYDGKPPLDRSTMLPPPEPEVTLAEPATTK
jgi:phospholipid-binding lipoprotein MlaA